MKKLYLLSLLLPLWTLLPLWGPGGRLFAAVQVTSISTDYANKRVTFALSWAAGTRNATHLSKVWVLVDYVEVNALNAPTGAWQRATVVSATATNGTVSGNTGRGFFVQGTDGAFSSTVTVTLTNVPAQFNWCAYATDYPPNATINAAGGYTLHGTAPFTVNGSQLGAGVRTYSGACITSITDPTGCPGLLPAAPTVTTTNPAAVCAGSGVTLTANVSGGTTTANTYTWNIGGATTTTTNTFAVPASSITTSKTFTVSVTNANKCTSAVSNTGTITVNAPGAAGQSSSPCGCAGGLQNCNGTCQATCGGSGSGNGTAVTNCSNPPSGFSFTSGFTSSSTWVVGSQTWSAPVTATYCNKATYSSPTSAPYAVDCRTNPGYDGHLFSWCMVAKFATTICPSGWRVPTSTDFCNLDKALNSRSDCSYRTDANALNRYISTWGGQYGGVSSYTGTLSSQGSGAYYWAQTECNATGGYNLYFLSNGTVYPQNGLGKYNGATLRCVK